MSKIEKISIQVYIIFVITIFFKIFEVSSLMGQVANVTDIYSLLTIKENLVIQVINVYLEHQFSIIDMVIKIVEIWPYAATLLIYLLYKLEMFKNNRKLKLYLYLWLGCIIVLISSAYFASQSLSMNSALSMVNVSGCLVSVISVIIMLSAIILSVLLWQKDISSKKESI